MAAPPGSGGAPNGGGGGGGPGGEVGEGGGAAGERRFRELLGGVAEEFERLCAANVELQTRLDAATLALEASQIATAPDKIRRPCEAANEGRALGEAAVSTRPRCATGNNFLAVVPVQSTKSADGGGRGNIPVSEADSDVSFVLPGVSLAMKVAPSDEKQQEQQQAVQGGPVRAAWARDVSNGTTSKDGMAPEGSVPELTFCGSEASREGARRGHPLPSETSGRMSGDERSSSFDRTLAISERIGHGAVGQYVRSPNSVSVRNLNAAWAEEQKAYAAGGTFYRVVTSSAFEGLFGVLILTNTLVMAAESQYQGIDFGYSLNYPGSLRPAAAAWPGATGVFQVFEVIFGVVFTLEVVLKLVALRRSFFWSAWNCFDAVVVLFWIVEQGAQAGFALNPMMLRLLRLLRLVRLARMMKNIQAMDSLQVLMGSIHASMAVLFWSTCLLLVLQGMVGMFLQSMLASYLEDTATPQEKRHEVYAYFGTFTRTMVTMFQLTLSNWVPVCRCLVDNVSEWYAMFIVIYKMVLGFAVINVIRGVFLHETFKVAALDDELMVIQKRRATQKHIAKMKYLLSQADKSGDGVMDRAEFLNALRNPELQVWLSAQDIEARDGDLLFDILDDGDGKISLHELVNGVSRLKGAARSIDVVALMHKVAFIEKMALDEARARRRSRGGSPVGEGGQEETA